jgi:hypothetical protein
MADLHQYDTGLWLPSLLIESLGVQHWRDQERRIFCASDLCGLDSDDRYQQRYLPQSKNFYMAAAIQKADRPYESI